VTAAIPMLKKDHEGVPVAKITFWGTTMAGKTTALTIIKVLKSLEDPSQVYKWLKLEDPTGRTLFFDQAIFGVGKDARGLPLLKYHVYTTPGQDRHSAQRKVVLRGSHGLIIVIDSEKVRWDDNKRSLMEINELAGDLLASGSLPYYILLNKMDLPKEQRISSLEVGKLLVESGASSKLKDAAVRIVEASCITASNDLKKLLTENPREMITDENGLLKKGVRPKSVQRVVKPVEFLIKEVVVNVLRQTGG
jgi:GTPase SAR1 family protein